MVVDKSWMVGDVSTLLEPRFIYRFSAEIFVVIVLLRIIREVRRRKSNRALHGLRPPRAAARSSGRLWSAIETLCRRTYLLIRLPGGGGAATTITPASQLPSQLSASEEGPEVVILPGCLINIWDGGSLEQGLRNMRACFKRINRPIQCGIASNSSRPSRYEYTYGVSSVDENSNDQDQHLEFKPFSLLNHGNVNLIDLRSLSQLEHMIHQCQIAEQGYPQVVYQVFADNSDVLSSFLCNLFNFTDLCINTSTGTDASQFTCQSAKNCVMALKTLAGLFCVMWKELAEVRCQSFHWDLKNHYFATCVRGSIENIIKAADSISNTKWSASHIYQMLVLNEAIADVLPAIQNLCSGRPNVSDKIYQQMRANFEGVFDAIKCFILNSLNGPGNRVTAIRHPATSFLIQSMKLFKNHNSIVQHIFFHGDGYNSLGHLLSEVIHYWAEKLMESSKLLPEPKGRKYIFVLNNLSCFALEIRNPLQVLLPSGEHAKILELLNRQINLYIFKYLDKCWSPVLISLLKAERNLQSSFDTFIAKFDDNYEEQRTWAVHTQLKTKLREEIHNVIAPSWDDFLEKQQKMPLRPLQRKATEKFEKRVISIQELFETEYEE